MRTSMAGKRWYTPILIAPQITTLVLKNVWKQEGLPSWEKSIFFDFATELN